MAENDAAHIALFACSLDRDILHIDMGQAETRADPGPNQKWPARKTDAPGGTSTSRRPAGYACAFPVSDSVYGELIADDNISYEVLVFRRTTTKVVCLFSHPQYTEHIQVPTSTCTHRPMYD